MFTGLVQATGTLRSIIPRAAGLELAVRCALGDVASGESIAVNGACLTATRVGAHGFAADVSVETVRATTLGRLTAGMVVNLERAVRVGDRLGGHIVTGHVDTVTTIERVRPVGDCVEVWFALPPQHSRLVAPKGSVSLDGVSLTVNDVCATEFSVMLIPHTRGATNLADLTVGKPVNFEADTVARYVARQLEVDSSPGEPTEGLAEKLQRTGFA